MKDFIFENDVGPIAMTVGGFWPSAYHHLIRQPLKLCGITIKRRFTHTKSIFDSWLGDGLKLVVKKTNSTK